MSNQELERLVYTVAEAGKLLGLSRNLTYESIRMGQIPSIRVGRRILIPRAALIRLLEGNYSNNTTQKSFLSLRY